MQCLGVNANGLGNGEATELVSCEVDNASHILWYISPGENPSVQLAEVAEPFCLDAGSTPQNNGPAKIWQCYRGLPQQKCAYRLRSNSS
jgi:hypothetical protein